MKRKLMKSRRRGFTALVMLVVALLLVAGIGLLGLGLNGRIFSIRNASNVVARCAADAGLTKAVYEMNQKLKLKPWNDSNLPQVTNQALPGCDATYSYTVTGDSFTGYFVEAIGKSDYAQKKVSCTLAMKGLFDYAIFTQMDISLKSGATVDWFNYDEYDPPFSIGTNSTEEGSIVLKNGATVNGNIVVGHGGDPDVVVDDAGADITGEIYSAPEVYEFPSVTVPEDLADLPSQGTLDDFAVLTGSAKYDSIDLGNNKVVAINGDVSLYITGDITLGHAAQLLVLSESINPNASLTLYVGGNIEVKNSAAFNNLTEDPKKLKIFALDTCDDIILKNSTDFYGAIYAPNTSVEMKNSSDAYGSIIAKSFEQKNSAAFYYDASLRDVGIDEAERFIVKYWREE